MSPSRRRVRPPPPSGTEREELARERRGRARDELLEVRELRDQPFLVLDVTNPVHGSRYRVFVPAFPALDPVVCTCTDFARRALGTCKHIEAARAWLGDHPSPVQFRRSSPSSTDVATRWRGIEARLRELPADPRPPGLKWRRPGAALYESKAAT